MLRRQRERLPRKSKPALASQCSEDAIRKQLEALRPRRWKSRRDELRQRLATTQQQLRELLEKRGRLSEQLAALAADKQLSIKQMDLAVIEKRLEDAIARWQVLATTCRILDLIRTTYERQRQPETLPRGLRLSRPADARPLPPRLDALGRARLAGRRRRGHIAAGGSLSRGTREQLFLSLRLALASSYARRGARCR